MHEHYAYTRFRIAPRAWREVTPRLAAQGASQVESAGGSLFGVFAGQIGLGANEGVALTAWPDRETLAKSSDSLVQAVEGVVTSSTERFVATVRPLDPSPPRDPGVFAHRTFELEESDWPEFLALSEGAWPSFERTNGARVVGFFRSLDVTPPRVRVLLLSVYPSLAVWESSRGHRPDTTTEPEAWQRFVRRAQLVDATVVVTTERIAP